MEKFQKIKNQAIIVQGTLGILISLLLTYYKFSSDPLVCGLGNCHAVQHSKYGSIFGIPVAILGIVYYLVLLFLHTNFSNKYIKIWLIWGILFSSYLTYIELFVLKEICGWCVVSFVNIIILYVVYYFGSRRSGTKNTNN